MAASAQIPCDDLERLAELIRARNANEVDIARVIGRPALLGHLGEYIASRIFNIKLHDTAVHPGSDGCFRAGPLEGKTVDVKMYSKRDGSLDIARQLPDYFLVLAGPKAPGVISGSTSPWGIKEVFLFETESLIARLKGRGVKIGTATSLRKGDWDRACIYPASTVAPLRLTDAQREALGCFDLFA